MAELQPNATATAKMNVNITTNNYIAQDGDTVTGVKKMSLKGIKQDATLAETAQVYNAFYALGAATTDSLSTVKTITEEVVQ